MLTKVELEVNADEGRTGDDADEGRTGGEC